jgi:hypothetical protein
LEIFPILEGNISVMPVIMTWNLVSKFPCIVKQSATWISNLLMHKFQPQVECAVGRHPYKNEYQGDHKQRMGLLIRIIASFCLEWSTLLCRSDGTAQWHFLLT